MINELRKIGYLFLRGFKQGTRPYISLMPEFIIPIFFFTVNSSAFQRVVELPGFPYDNYVQFYAPVALLTAIFVSSGSTGIEIVTDIATGYMDRLFLAPVRREYLILAKLAAVGLKSMTLTGIMILLLFLFGAPFQGGIVGVLTILLFAFIFAMAWSGIGLSLAFVSKNPRVVQSAFIFFFPFSTITTAQMPLEYLDGWYKVAVQINPVTYILEGMRAVIMEGTFGSTVLIGLAVASAFAFVTLTVATRAFNRSIVKK